MCRSPSDLNLVLSSDFNKMLVVELFVVGLVEQMMDFFSLAGLRLLPMENRPLSKAVSKVCEMIRGLPINRLIQGVSYVSERF